MNAITLKRRNERITSGVVGCTDAAEGLRGIESIFIARNVVVIGFWFRYLSYIKNPV